MWRRKRVLINSRATLSHHHFAIGNRADDVFLQTVRPCPHTWSTPERCVRVRYAIPLASANALPAEQHIATNANDELSTERLEDMWRTYGSVEFASHWMPEYSVPDTDHMLLLWSAIGLGIVLLFLVLLYTIWKMDILRDYHPMPLRGKRAEDRKSILDRKRSENDLSMFPSPHQIVPSLFPSAGDPMAANGLQHGKCGDLWMVYSIF